MFVFLFYLFLDTLSPFLWDCRGFLIPAHLLFSHMKHSQTSLAPTASGWVVYVMSVWSFSCAEAWIKLHANTKLVMHMDGQGGGHSAKWTDTCIEQVLCCDCTMNKIVNFSFGDISILPALSINSVMMVCSSYRAKERNTPWTSHQSLGWEASLLHNLEKSPICLNTEKEACVV